MILMKEQRARDASKSRHFPGYRQPWKTTTNSQL